MDTIQARFRHARELRSLTQGDVARHFRVDRGTVYRWETGQTQMSLQTLIELAEFLNVERAWLVFGDGEAPVAMAEPARKVRRKAS